MSEIDGERRRPNLRVRGLLGERTPGDAELRELGDEWGVSSVAARLLLARGIDDADRVRKIVQPRLQDLRRPDAMAGFAPALDVLVSAIRGRRRVGIFGDYDVDGVTTTAVLATYLGALGVEVVANVATRQGGYGFHLDAARTLADAGCDLVLTGDCGTSDHEALAWLESRGIQTVVIDHHQVPSTRPPATALINPHQQDCEFPFKGLCSAGVAFYLCAALRTRLREQGWESKLPDPRAWLDLVALGTVCDMVPLVDENRVLVRHGLLAMGHRRRPGVRALLRRAGVGEQTEIDEGHLGFQLGPRLNAPGRLASAAPALNLLRSRSDAEAEPFAAEVEKFNQQRRVHQDRIVAEAIALLDADARLSSRAGIVVAGRGWAPGVVGIAANGLVDRYQRPALVLAIDGEGGEVRGSVRTHGGIDVHAALARCEQLLTRFGGHKAAAGVSLEPKHVEALIDAFDRAVAEQHGDAETAAPAHEHDGELRLEDIDLDLTSELRSVAPFGQSFPAPRFVSEEVVVEDVRIIKERHLKLRVRQGETRREAIAFGKAAHPVSTGDTVGLSFVPEKNEFGGRTRVQLRVDEIW